MPLVNSNTESVILFLHQTYLEVLGYSAKWTDRFYITFMVLFCLFFKNEFPIHFNCVEKCCQDIFAKYLILCSIEENNDESGK